jgi:Domain of unknown function (DUF4397)
MSDELTTPAGKALVRVIQASLKQQAVGVSWDGTVVVSKLAFDSVTSYQAVVPGTETVTATGATGSGQDASSHITLAAGTAPHGPGSPLPWLVVIGAGSLLALTGGLRLRRLAR